MVRSPVNARQVDELGHILIQLEVLRSGQWTDASRESSSISGVLSALQRDAAWWDPSHPAISDYQRLCISSRLQTLGFRDLDRDLRVNGYLILDKLGSGGMAIVHKAWSLDLGHVVAVKRLSGNSQILRDRLEREARILRLLDDPRITQYVAFEAIEDGSGHLLAMEYIEGETLRDFLQTQPRVPLAQAIHWTSEVLDALAHAHERGVVHRDVTPRNIMIQRNGAPDSPVKLLDFGLGKVTATSLFSIPEIAAHPDLTGQCEAIGTAPYMSPEQFRDAASVTGAADVYSLGCCLYEMIAGRPPFTESQFAALCFKHINEEPPDIRLFCPGLPDYVAMALKRMLSKRAKDRSDASEIKAILLKVSPTGLSKPPHGVAGTEPTRSVTNDPEPPFQDRGPAPVPMQSEQQQALAHPYKNW